MKNTLIFLSIFFVNPVFSQLMGSGPYLPANYGTRNHNSTLNSFKYGIIGSNQDATGSPTGLIAAIIRRVPSAKKVSDRYGNPSVSLRGRNSIVAAGDEVLWEIDGVTFQTPPMLSVNEVIYVEIIKGITTYNVHVSESPVRDLFVMTSDSPSKKDLINSPKNL